MSLLEPVYRLDCLFKSLLITGRQAVIQDQLHGKRLAFDDQMGSEQAWLGFYRWCVCMFVCSVQIGCL